MRISVVIPTYNRRDTLIRALRSVYEQSDLPEEVIVVDDGSTDDSRQLVTELFPSVKIIRQENQGVSCARNRGIEAAEGDWIALLDSDDCWLPRKIEKIRAAWRAEPEQVLFHSDEIWIRCVRRVNQMRKHRKSGGWIFSRCLPLCAISPSAAVIRRSTLIELGMFDEDLPACEDYDLWLRLCHRYPVHYTDEPLIIKHGGHDDQLSRRYPAMDRFRVRALHRLLTTSDLGPSDYDAAARMLRSKLEILLRGASRHANHAVIEEFEPLRNTWLLPEGTAAPC